MTQALSWVVRMYSELEVNVVSVERVNEYSELATERALVSSSPPPGDWPQKGLHCCLCQVSREVYSSLTSIS